jgi:EAL domain-containing protein (putative c-di-GMP-specific phosphodiesterase class I)
LVLGCLLSTICWSPAYEALARWPSIAGASPGTVFAQAEQQGRLSDVDWACRDASLRAALAGSDLGGHTLFLNVEPASVGKPLPRYLAETIETVGGRLRVLLELTERALFTHPAELMRTIDAARGQGWGVALDDMGADPASLAMLPFVSPDVIKLDMSLVQDAPTRARAQVMTAVMAHAERTGATILAEGVESSAHRERALALGATLGQGWLFGRPGPLANLPVAGGEIRFAQAYPSAPETPFDLVEASGQIRVARKSLLMAFSRNLESHALALPTPPVLLGAFQSVDRFTPATARRYRAIAERCAFVGALGADLPSEPVPGVRGGRLNLLDRLRGEWTVAVVGDHYTGALIARDLGDDGPEMDRRFEFMITHERETVLAAARSLMNRLLPVAETLPES